MKPQLTTHIDLRISTLIFSIVFSAFFRPQLALSQVGSNVAVVPEPRRVEFSLDNSRDVPEDIQEQITWFVGEFGGGGGCIEGIDSPLWHWQNYSEDTQDVYVTVGSMTWCVQDTDLSQQFLQSLSATITLPDRSEQPLSLAIDTYDNGSYILFTYEFGPGSQLGKYIVELTSNDRNWVDDFNLLIPSVPTVDFNYDPDKFGLDNAWLIGFEPNERIRTLVYDGDFNLDIVGEFSPPILLTFLAEQWFEVDENGMLVISFAQLRDEHNPMLMVLDEATNQVIGTNIPRDIEIGDYTVLDSIFDSCTEVVTPRLSIGDTARVTFFNNGLPLRVRNQPGLSGELLTPLSEGTIVNILAGPSCIDGYWWWGIQTNDERGWAAEGDDVDYFLEKVR